MLILIRQHWNFMTYHNKRFRLFANNFILSIYVGASRDFKMISLLTYLVMVIQEMRRAH
jgi:hypothetical protein